MKTRQLNRTPRTLAPEPIRRLAPFCLALSTLLGMTACNRASPADTDKARDLAPRGARTSSHAVVHGDIAFEFEAELVGEPKHDQPPEIRATLRLNDATSGQPLTGARPLVWMSEREGTSTPNDQGCREKVRSFLGGLLSARPAADLNSYLLLTMNEDNTLSVINPLLAFSRTKLERLVTLSGYPVDWAATPSSDEIYLSIPSSNRVAVVDARRFLVTSNVEVGRKPIRVAPAPDGTTVWVGNDGESSVSVIDSSSHHVRAKLAVGAGHHEIVFLPERKEAWISSGQGNSIHIFDSQSLRAIAEITVGADAVSLAFSATANIVALAQESTGQIFSIDPNTRQIVSKKTLARGLAYLRFDPSGRFAFASAPPADKIFVLDIATDEARDIEIPRPDQIVFSDRFAYVRSLKTEKVTLIDLSALKKGDSTTVVEVPFGQTPPGSAHDVGIAAPIAILPSRDGAIVAQPADRTVFFYNEGMMAPMGSHKNYNREPRAAMILDRTLKETAPGVYTTTVPIRGFGTFDVEVLMEPKTVACLEWRSPANLEPPQEDRPTTLELVQESLDPTLVVAAKKTTIRFKLFDKATKASLSPAEIEAVVFRVPGTWRQPLRAEPLKENTFQIEFTPPSEGQYKLMIGSTSRGAPIGALPAITIGARSVAAQGAKR